MKLLTGGTGFLGSYLLFKLVSQGESVRAIRRPTSGMKQLELAFHEMNKGHFPDFHSFTDKIQWAEADITDLESINEAMDGVDEIFHAAAVVTFQKKDWRTVLENNISGTSNLVNLALKNGIDRFHYISSISSLDRGDKEFIDENTFGTGKEFRTVYSLSKYKAELEVWRGYNEGLKGCMVNPGVVLGPAVEENEATKIFRRIQRGFKYYSLGMNGYVDVRDCADFIYDLSKREDLFKQRFILVSGNVRYKELFDQIASAFGVNPPAIKAGKIIGYTVALMDSISSFFRGKDPVITREMVKMINSKFEYRTDKIAAVLSREFIPIEQTITDTCRFLQKV